MTKTLLATAMAFAISACGDSRSPLNTEQDPILAKGTATELSRNTAANLPPYIDRDIEDEVFYFVLPDRFHNGDPSNDNGSATLKMSQGGFDKSKSTHYHGGDIDGLKEKIPYLKNMGITSIWLTPIMRNQAVQGDVTGYHGYWVLDFSEVDPHLGSNADLKSLIDTAHDNNIKVFFDIITNHSADVIKYTECHGDNLNQWSDGAAKCTYKSLAQLAAGDRYTPVLPKGMENAKNPQWLNDPKYYHNQGDSTFSGENSLYGDFHGLDDLNTDDPAVLAGFIDLFKDLVTEFKPDGFRIDTMKHVNIEFWQGFAPTMVEHAKAQGIPNFFMFGEVYDGNSDVLSKYTTTGKVQSVLDFGFQFAVRDVLVDQAGNHKLAAVFANDHKYNDHDSNAGQLLNFIGNHDVGRFAHALASSKHNYSDKETLARLTQAHAMMYFLRGVPVIYYGSEQGFVGDGGNHDSRQDMMPSKVASYNDDQLIGSQASTADDNFDPSHPLYQSLAHFASVYHSHPVLRSGKQEIVYSSNDNGLLAVSRTNETGESYLVLFNTANKPINIQLDFAATTAQAILSKGKNRLIIRDRKASIAMSALAMAVYKLK